MGMNDALFEQFANELLFEEELAPKTVKDILVVVRSILDYTAKRFPGTFPTLNINYPKESKKEMRVLSREEQTRFSRFLLWIWIRVSSVCISCNFSREFGLVSCVFTVGEHFFER